MAVATCQFTQGSTVGGSGLSVFGFQSGSVVTLTDAGGSGATSYLWELLSWPAPLAIAPVVSNSTSQVASITPTTDGTYIFRLTRTEGTTITTDYKFFGVSDEDGLTLPSAGQSGNMTNQTVSTQRFGWAGNANATTNFQLDAYLRFLKFRVGQYVGHVVSITCPNTVTTTSVQDGVDKPFRVLTATATSKVYTEALVLPATEGKRFRYIITLNTTSGGIQVLNGVGGSVLLALPAPPLGNVTYEAEFVCTGSNWILVRSNIVGANTQFKLQEINLVAGVRSTNQTLQTRVGSARFNPADYPANAQIKLVAHIEATAGKTAALQVYNLTDGVYVGSPLFASLQIPTEVEQVLTLTSGIKDYEVMIWMTATGGPADMVTCTSAKFIARWG